MSTQQGATPESDVLREIRSLAHPLSRVDDLDPLVDRAGAARFVCLGEASHGTHEYYRWRAELSRRLIEEHGFTWIGVEGDWPDCWRINRWVRGQDDQALDADGLPAGFGRWPTWMWANREVADAARRSAGRGRDGIVVGEVHGLERVDPVAERPADAGRPERAG